MGRRFALLAVMVTAALGWSAGSSGAEEKSYSFPLVTIDATVQQDGSLKVLEHRTFDFHGQFHFAYFDIKWPPPRIAGFKVLEHGQPIITTATTEVDGKFRGIWTFSAQDERRTFTISYTARCAVDVFADTAHLLWQFVGTGWSAPTDHLRVTVHLPGRAARTARPKQPCPPQPKGPDFPTTPLHRGDVRAWGHGPFNGRVRILDPQTVRLAVNGVPPNTFVEGSITFPPRSVPKAHLVSEKRLPAILANERRLANEANDLRHKHDLERTITWILFGLLPALFLLLLFIAHRRDRVPGVPRTIQEPPDDVHPVELAYMWGAYRGHLSPSNAYRAQLLHLAQIRAIEVSAVGRVSDPEDFTLRLLRKPEQTLDSDFVDFLFLEDGQRPLSLERVKATGKRRSKLLQWSKDVGAKTKGTVTRIRKGKSRAEGIAATLLGLGGVAAGFFLGSDVAGKFAYWLIPLSLIGWFVMARLMPPRLGSKLRKRLARWKAFRRFLKSFSSLSNAPALAVIIWEKYMVDAVALGVAKRVTKQVKALVPEERLPSPWPGAPPGQYGYFWLHNLQSSHVARASAVVASSSPSWSGGWGSSSSGGGFGGGGFSGGGGGGGGGTGGGAG